MKTERPPSTFAHKDQRPSAVFAPNVASRLLENYRPWRKLRYVATELGVDPVAAWAFVKEERASSWQSIGIPRAEGGEFGFVLTKHLLEPLFTIDRSLSRTNAFGAGDNRVARTLRERWNAIVLESESSPVRIGARTLMEEAAESSIMEGAATTRREAIEMLRAGRPPVNRGERMVLNNFHAMQQVKDWTTRQLSIEMILELQDLITEGTLDDPSGGGRLRGPAEVVRVVDSRDEEVIFTPPPAALVPSLLESICAFLNHQHEGEYFIHPLVKACMLHFLIGYAHPFVDGNGRTARALFYWASLRAGYDIFEYLTISEVIRKGFARYPQAYVDSEVDDGDLTYFVLYKLEVITQALGALGEHLKAEQERLQRSERLLALGTDLNLRQRLLLEHGARHHGTLYTVKSHAASNGVALLTARTDLEDLVSRGLMTTTKRGREVIYHLRVDLRTLLPSS
jgi:Fic family protein